MSCQNVGFTRRYFGFLLFVVAEQPFVLHISLDLETTIKPASSICLNRFSEGCAGYCSVSGNKTHAGNKRTTKMSFLNRPPHCALVHRAPLSLFNPDTEPQVEAFSTALNPHVTLTFSFPLRFIKKRPPLKCDLIHHRKNSYVG